MIAQNKYKNSKILKNASKKVTKHDKYNNGKDNGDLLLKLVDKASFDNKFLHYDIVIIGGGISGIYTALLLDRLIKDKDLNIRVLVIEQNEILLKKIPATGNGRANVGNLLCSSETYYTLANRDENIIRKFLAQEKYASCLKSFFREKDIFLREENYRLYPSHLRAEAFRETLIDLINRSEIDYICCCKCKDVLISRETKITDLHDQNRSRNVNIPKQFKKYKLRLHINKDKYNNKISERNNKKLYRQNDLSYELINCEAEYIIFASGGIHSPQFGQAEDSNKILDKLANKKNPRLPALTSIEVLNKSYFQIISGQRMQIMGTLYDLSRKIKIPSYGEFQFTTYGLSGIPTMDLSGLRMADSQNPYLLQMTEEDKRKLELMELVYSPIFKDTQSRQIICLDLLSNISLRNIAKGSNLYFGNNILELQKSATNIKEEKDLIDVLISRASKLLTKNKVDLSENKKRNIENNEILLTSISKQMISKILLPFFDKKIISYIVSIIGQYTLDTNKIFSFDRKIKTTNIEMFREMICKLEESGLSKNERVDILYIYFILKNIPFFLADKNRKEQAQITAGGVCLSEIDEQSLSLKSDHNIYLVGESLDINGCCGGFNLHFAYLSAKAVTERLGVKLIEYSEQGCIKTNKHSMICNRNND